MSVSEKSASSNNSLPDKLNSTTPLFHLKLYIVLSIVVLICIILFSLLIFLCLRLNRNSRKRKMRVKHSSGMIPLVSKEIVEIKALDLNEKNKFGEVKIGNILDLKKKKESEEEESDDVSGVSDVSLSVEGQNNIGWGRWFSLKELEMATRGFVEESVIGEGGYGVVYRGVLHDGSVVAVKNLLNNK